ncbi:MAG: endonuclease domain-containing protein [Candidatus Hydrogenedentes bacterium]|nr:endonuclease domain-containing protein [Candidatus Hydrogenedentota bacterium]
MVRVGFNHNQSILLTGAHLVLSQRRVRRLTPEGGWSGIPLTNFGRARRMRHAMSPPELAVWNRLRSSQLGVKFRAQHPIGSYIADSYCREVGLVVEIDGIQHGESQAAGQYDRRRDAFMENYGMTVLRFTSHEVGHRLEEIISTIARVVGQHTIKGESEKQWRFAEELRVGDAIYGCPAGGHQIVQSTVSEVHNLAAYDVWVENHDSFLVSQVALREGYSGL